MLGGGVGGYGGQATLPSVGSREAAMARQRELQAERERQRMGGGTCGNYAFQRNASVVPGAWQPQLDHGCGVTPHTSMAHCFCLARGSQRCKSRRGPRRTL